MAEEVTQQPAAFLVEYPGGYGHLMIQTGMVEDLQNGACRARLGVGRSVDEALEASVNHGSGAHGTWLQRDKELAFEEPVVSNSSGGCAHGDDLGVGGRIGVA